MRRAFAKLWTGTRILVGTAVVIAASIGAAWGAKNYVTKSPRFMIKTITVEGANKLAPETIAKAGGVAVGMNVFTVDVEQVKRSIEREPYVAEATVVRQLPNTISIKVVERQPAVLVGIGNDLYLATHDGDVFKQAEAGDATDLPVVTGIRPELAVEDRQGLSILVRRALDVIDEAEKTGIAKRYPVQEIHIEKDGSVEAIVGQQGIAIHLGNPPFKGKVEQADRVLAEVEKRKSSASIVFLDNDANPDRVVVRMR
jgi:cell division protein FtsQ